jgi:amidase
VRAAGEHVRGFLHHVIPTMTDESSPQPSVSRRAFVSLAAGAAAGAVLPHSLSAASAPDVGSPVPSAPEVVERSITDVQGAMARGETTSRALVEQYLARIDAMDRRGPALRAVIETNPDALAIADALDAERRAGRVRGPLHGVPILIKDNIDTADRMLTTAGSLALEGSRPSRDAFIVERLRAAGAVLLGKTNLSEWANFRSTHSSSGWSARGGQTRNPYAADRTPSGSSSGSAVAAAASYGAAAVGTETDGSILSPAAACSLVGLKPTIGLVSRRGIIPIAHSQDTAGPMTRTVRDAALLLGVLAGADAGDRVTRAARITDYAAALDRGGLRGARIGVARRLFAGRSTVTDRVMEEALRALASEGATIVDPADIASADQFGEAEYEVLLHEFKADLEAYLASRPAGARIRTLADLIAFNRAHAAEEMPWFGQEIVEMAAKKGPLRGAAYRRALARCGQLARVRGIDATLAAHRLDAIVTPTQGPPALTDLLNGDPSFWTTTSPSAVAGYPAITVPMGYASGLPIGLTFMGAAWSEPSLLRYAYAFEQATKVRVAPRYLATAELAVR